MKKSISILSILIAFISCHRPEKLVRLYKDLEKIAYTDQKVLEAISNYEKENNPENFLIILVQDKKDIFLTRMVNLSSIYRHPISSYFYFNGKPVLVYSKKDKYVYPPNYPESFLNEVKRYLHDDWYLICRDGGIEFTPMITDHSDIWVLKPNNKIIKKTPFDLNLSKIQYGQKEYDFTYYQYLIEYRIK
ncbi:hypothetical protein [Aquimarina brevivitae]|uniref:Lipoprotein n=1 Tax=Aquimarina brevivitae TaxID=323412 RepID=A0A4V2F5K9_9FLAO|nr:hypothetical protein [Aquimarina brevivitae]RZS93179.1 hypothetical protein EV197_1749 [Aquimarina brevivitae]